MHGLGTITLPCCGCIRDTEAEVQDLKSIWMKLIWRVPLNAVGLCYVQDLKSILMKLIQTVPSNAVGLCNVSDRIAINFVECIYKQHLLQSDNLVQRPEVNRNYDIWIMPHIADHEKKLDMVNKHLCAEQFALEPCLQSSHNMDVLEIGVQRGSNR